MKPFEFRLQTLMKIRQSERDQKRAELSEAYRALDILHDQENELQASAQETQEHKSALQSKGEVAVDRVIDHQRFQLLVAAQIGQIAQQKSQIEEEIERRRNALVEADRDVRALERMKEKQLARHQENAAKLETKQFDEIASVRSGKQRSGGTK